MRNLSGYIGCLHKLAILSVFLSVFLLLVPAAAVAEETSTSVGTDIAQIIGVSYLGEERWVEIANKGTGSINLTGWKLTNTLNQTYSFPANFILKSGRIVRVYGVKDNDTDTNTATNTNTATDTNTATYIAADFFNSNLLWNREGDTATLLDANGRAVSIYKYPVEVSSPVSMVNDEPLLLEDTSSIIGTLQPFLPDYRSNKNAKTGSFKSSSPVNLTDHPFICHGGPLNWAWTSGLR